MGQPTKPSGQWNEEIGGGKCLKHPVGFCLFVLVSTPLFEMQAGEVLHGDMGEGCGPNRGVAQWPME